MITDFEYDQLVELLFLDNINFGEAQNMLELSDDQMRFAISRLEQDGFIVTHTVH
jgi:hypothetical protein